MSQIHSGGLLSGTVRGMLGVAIVLALLAAGCAGVSTAREDANTRVKKPETAASARQRPLPTAGADLTLNPGGGLTEDVLYTVLVAELAGQRGQVDIALSNYMLLMRAIPSPQLAERAARVAAFAQKDAETLEATRRWVQLDGRSLEARQLLAASLIRAGRLDEALVHLNYVLGAEDGDAGQRMWAVANLLSREQDKRAAVTVMEKLIEQHGRKPEALFAYALLAIRAEQMDRARAAMDQVVDFTPGNVGVAIAYVGVLQKQGETAAALKWLETVLAKHPDQHDLRLAYARLLADEKRYEQARKEFARLEKVQPDSADIQYALGLLELQLERVDKARNRFARLVKVGEHADEARFYLGQIAESKKDEADARKWYGEVKDGKLRFEAQLRLALMLARHGKLKEAQDQLHGMEPASDEERNGLIRAEGEILAEAGQYQAAMEVYDGALNERYDSELLYTRAMLAEKMGRLDILERDLRQIIEREPENSQALNALGYTLADRTTRYEEALKLIERAIALAPDDFYILDSMGWVLFRLGRLDDAITYLKRARALRDDPEVAAHLAEVLWVKGERQAARDVWEGALKTSPGDKKLLKLIERLGP
ncbi:MAG: tetratricopeptide repeat protein [Chromatiales bacterium]